MSAYINENYLNVNVDGFYNFNFSGFKLRDKFARVAKFCATLQESRNFSFLLSLYRNHDFHVRAEEIKGILLGVCFKIMFTKLNQQ